ncbi:MAG TPA: c-type cytochrome [Casimicrobiaceae bacterium]|nr:c-type cytochrome [Casimicrobiaceae bacterium]
MNAFCERRQAPASKAHRARHTKPLVALSMVAALAACSDPSLHPQAAGDATRGRMLLQQYGCGACHRIPGVPGANSAIGPSLDRLGRRVYVAGVLPNSPAELARWIRAPDVAKPGTAMPNANVTERDATDIVAYLYQLR